MARKARQHATQLCRIESGPVELYAQFHLRPEPGCGRDGQLTAELGNPLAHACKAVPVEIAVRIEALPVIGNRQSQFVTHELQFDPRLGRA